MAQDLRKLIGKPSESVSKKVPEGHGTRFENRLKEEFPERKPGFPFMRIAISILMIISLGIGTIFYFVGNDSKRVPINSLADISPELRKIEDYYLNHINYQIAKIEITDRNQVYLETYFSELSELQAQYQERLETIKVEEVSEETIDFLIENLQSRLKLMFQLKAQLKKLNQIKISGDEKNQLL